MNLEQFSTDKRILEENIKGLISEFAMKYKAYSPKIDTKTFVEYIRGEGDKEPSAVLAEVELNVTVKIY